MDGIKTRGGYTPPTPDHTRIRRAATLYEIAIALAWAGSDDREAMFR